MGLKSQPLIFAGSRHLEIHRHEGRIVHRDADLFDRRDEEILVAFLLQDRREQPHQFEPPDRGAEVEPRSIARNPYVEIPAIWRIPQVNRWQTAL